MGNSTSVLRFCMSKPERKSIPPATPEPASALAVYTQLSPNAGIHVSPVQLGAMSIGDRNDGFLGDINKESF